jgi:branched-chain amino acid transport system ATP-binding protein
MMLDVADLHAFYGKSHILQGISFQVPAGEIVALLGRNGAGKTTTLSCIAGLIGAKRGKIRFAGQEIQEMPAHRVSRAGICLVPEHRGIFKLLTVEENLAIAARKESRWDVATVYRMFPRLAERRRNSGATLSGGEQQMLAIARALVNAPRLLLLDEPTEGLAPVIVEELQAAIGAIREREVPVLLVEQNLAFCLALADRSYILEQGRFVHHDMREEFDATREVRERYLTLG